MSIPGIVAKKIQTGNRNLERYRIMSPAFSEKIPFCLFAEYVFNGIAGFEIKIVDSEQTQVIKKVKFKNTKKTSERISIRPHKLSMVSVKCSVVVYD